VHARYGEAIEHETRHKREVVAALEAEAQDSVAAAVLAVGSIRAEADSAVSAAMQEAEAEAYRLEQERIRQLEAHQSSLRELEENLERDRLAADQRIVDVELEVQAVYDNADATVLQTMAARETALRVARDRGDVLSVAAEERCRAAQEAERQAKAAARQAVSDVEKERSIRLGEAERSCQDWIDAFNQLMVDTQTGLAERLEQLLGDARKIRANLEENRIRADQHWNVELVQLRQDAVDQNLQAATTMQEARSELRHAEIVARDIAVRGRQECQTIEHDQILALRAIALELEETRRALGLKARDQRQPALVQSLKDLAARFRSGQFANAPPRLDALTAPAAPRLANV
ncbi:unnamed protein product, partial [Polarella glacialis]